MKMKFKPSKLNNWNKKFKTLKLINWIKFKERYCELERKYEKAIKDK
jgi:hypothetical protein